MAEYNFIISLNFPYYAKHGKNFIESFLKCTGEDCKLHVYTENSFDSLVQKDFYNFEQDFINPRVEFRDIWKLTNVGAWQDACIPIQEAKSGLPVVFDPHQRIEQRAQGYDYRFDALAHSKAMFAQKHLLSTLESAAKVLFFDVDIVWLKKLDDVFFATAFPSDVDLEYLGRSSHHSETGYFSYKNEPITQAFYDRIVWYYTSGAVFKLPFWTDSHVFDHVRTAETEFVNQMRFLNISGVPDGHVFINSFLGKYMDHLKGARKYDGRSPASEYFLFPKPETEI